MRRTAPRGGSALPLIGGGALLVLLAVVLAAAVLPYAWTVIAKGSGDRFDNRDPRGWLARQENPLTIRANAAQLNAFEAFAPFAAAVATALS